VRLFIAIPLPPDIASRAATVIPPALPALRRVPPENLHVTLAFLGWTDEARLGDVIASARAAASPVARFRLELAGAGRFPGTGRPRVVWIGIASGATSVHELSERVGFELRSRDIRFDDRPLSPHLTLARVANDATGPEAQTIAAAVPELVTPDLAFDVASIAVMQSALSPKGARYSVAATAELAPE
jgi:2'-5' RNA ligase